jgi:hypothetical protein
MSERISYRLCGRKVKRQDMSIPQLNAAIRWCKSEIKKLEKEKERQARQRQVQATVGLQ